MDFLRIVGHPNKRGVMEIKPDFFVRKSKDLMIRAGDFYAIWDPENNRWSTDEDDVIRLIDSEVKAYAEKHKDEFENGYKVLYMVHSETKLINDWHRYCQKEMRDNYHNLDEKIIFSNTVTTKEDYCSKRLSYPLEEGEPEAYDHLMSTLYSPEERHKIEWAIGAVITGGSKKLQKFIVLYGDPGTGKSTVLDIIEKLFPIYTETVDAKALGNSNSSFALEPFQSNPMVAIEHESNLSRIDDNSRLNSLVAHNKQLVNVKHKSQYGAKFNTFLFLATNEPVKITNAKSGLLRRLIDVTPTGKTLKTKDYLTTMDRIEFEKGKIANRCKKIFEEDPHYYDKYTPVNMMMATNDFYNFVSDSYYIFKRDDGVTLQAAWDMYKVWCEDAKVSYPYDKKKFQEELRNYFNEFHARVTLDNGTRPRKYYRGFKSEKFDVQFEHQKEEEPVKSWLSFDKTESLFNDICADCPAQYANDEEKPLLPWDSVTTKLADIDTTKVHYVRIPDTHIVIDFDIPDSEGKKCFEKNLEAASLWPKTYAELSKSGAGIHLHYIYTGDPAELSRVYGDHIEIKVFTGKSSLRRKLTKCNDIPIAQISSGLPLREKKKMTDKASIKSEAKLVELIQRNLRKEIHSATKPSVDFIYKILEDAYDSGLHYDVSWMYDDILRFALNSTNQREFCQELVGKMKFQSKDISDYVESSDDILTFFDIESAPNHFLVCSMLDQDDATVIPMLDPKPDDIYAFIERKLVGYNNLNYDNNMLYGCMIGETPAELFARSNAIIQRNEGKIRESRGVSYADLYQILSKKQSLKKWEIELGEPHKEFPLSWDEPIPDDMLDEWIEYCCNDVRATRALWHARKPDVDAHKIFARISGGTMNDTTNQLTTKFIFGNNREPQSEFNYRDMGEISEDDTCPYDDDPYTRFNTKGQPIFPGYKFSQYGLTPEDVNRPDIAPEKMKGVKSWYRGENPKEGGYVYAEYGIYCNVALLDIKSMHPASINDEELFGPRYTPRFKDIRDARIAIKEKDFESAAKMLDGVLAEFLSDESVAEDLAYALKIAINAVYGQTSAGYSNPFRDPRNKDNIVAKRGALFMINLKHQVQKRGFTVAHIKTDSIKIPDATPEIISFVMEYGKMYGYEFDHEATYEKMCLVNDAVYIAKYASNDSCMNRYGYLPSKQHEGKWTATGTQFQVPYVFKTLFSHEPIEFKDLCETREVKDPASLYLDFNEGLPEGEHDYRFIGKVGLVCPIQKGCGGAELMRGTRNKETGVIKYDHASSSKDFRWMEADNVKNFQKEALIDRGYYQKLVDKAAKDIAAYGDLEWFLS